MASKKKNQYTYGGRKNPPSSFDDLKIFEQNGMTEAGALLYFTFLQRLTKICTIPNRRALNEVWKEPKYVEAFQERFLGTSISAEPSPMFKSTSAFDIDLARQGAKCRRALSLLDTLIGNDIGYVNQFVEMNLQTQIAMIDAIIGLEAIDGGTNIPGVDDYLFLQQCTDNLHKLTFEIGVPIAEISLKPVHINDLMFFWQEHSSSLKTKEVFQKLSEFGLDSSTCCACLYAIADTTGLAEDLLTGAFNSISELETAYMVRKGSTKKKRWI